MREKHLKLTDKDFEDQFQQCTLDPTLFTHEAHLRLAWIHITQYGEEEAIKHITSQIKAFALHLGLTDKYNHTVTVAAIKAVHHFMKLSGATAFTDFIAEFPVLKNNFMELIHTHYGIDIFHSTKAKTEYVEPDLVPFD
jgi:N-formylglutamate deformylase